MTRLLLLPSPLTGAAVWAPVAALLRDHGWRVTVADLGAPVRTPRDVLARFEAHLDADPDSEDAEDAENVVLVPHSNAGLYVAALASRRAVRGIVLVDAGIPSGEPTTPTAPAAFRALLGGLPREDDDLLPPWTSWWPEEEVTALFPDGTSRVRVQDQEPRLPLGYFDESVPSPLVWETLPAAYLAFGQTYADEQAEARRRGWPVTTLAEDHLLLLVDPAEVTDALERLVNRLISGDRLEQRPTD